MVPRERCLKDLAHRWTEAINNHDLEGVVACFAADYLDEAPARPGESVRGENEVRANFGRMFREIPDLAADLRGVVAGDDEVWIEWRLHGTRPDGSRMEFVGVNIFGVINDRFATGRVYTELVRKAGGIDAQLNRMTKGTTES